MNFRDKKGSIAIFVLVGLLFMSAVLFISFSNNVNKSKVVKEQFDIISEIYSYGEGESGAYDKAYTDLRKKNKQTMNASSEGLEKTASLKLTKTFDEKINNYRIYGNSVQEGTPSTSNPVEIKSVGDKTVNLVEYPYQDSDKTINGITYKDNGDGTITANGTATANAIFNIKTNMKTTWEGVVPNEKYTVSLGYTGNYTGGVSFAVNYYKNTATSVASYSGWVSSVIGKSNTKVAPADISGLRTYILISSGAKVENLILKPQFELGEKATEYGPYGKYKIPVIVRGKNYFNINNIQEINSSNYSLKVSENKLILNGTLYSCNTKKTLKDVCPNLKVGDEVILRLNTTCSKKFIYLYKDNTTAISWEDGKTKTITEDLLDRVVIVYNEVSLTEPNEVIISNIQITDVGEDANYEPYVEPLKTTIYLNEPLRKIGNCADYIDFKEGKVVRNIKHREFTESDSWSKYVSANNHYQISVGDNYYSGTENYVLSNYYLPRKNNNSYYSNEDYGVMSVDGKRIRFKNKDYSTLDEWIAYLSSLDDKLYVLYRLEKTDETEKIELPELSTYEDYTKIEVLTDVEPSIIEVEYQGYTLE